MYIRHLSIKYLVKSYKVIQQDAYNTKVHLELVCTKTGSNKQGIIFYTHDNPRHCSYLITTRSVLMMLDMLESGLQMTYNEPTIHYNVKEECRPKIEVTIL